MSRDAFANPYRNCFPVITTVFHVNAQFWWCDFLLHGKNNRQIGPSWDKYPYHVISQPDIPILEKNSLLLIQ